jgi:hypothetical protein
MSDWMSVVVAAVSAPLARLSDCPLRETRGGEAVYPVRINWTCDWIRLCLWSSNCLHGCVLGFAGVDFPALLTSSVGSGDVGGSSVMAASERRQTCSLAIISERHLSGRLDGRLSFAETGACLTIAMERQNPSEVAMGAILEMVSWSAMWATAAQDQGPAFRLHDRTDFYAT